MSSLSHDYTDILFVSNTLKYLSLFFLLKDAFQNFFSETFISLSF